MQRSTRILAETLLGLTLLCCGIHLATAEPAGGSLDPEPAKHRPLRSLPASGTQDAPVILLELGRAPAALDAAPDASLRVRLGTATAGEETESLLEEPDEVQIFHQGFGSWSANFDFALDPEIRPGRYRLYARYKSGGEVSQVAQEFTIQAGKAAGQTEWRANFSVTNPTPWEYQWLQAPTAVTLFPGDRWIAIHNAGKADTAKVFDAFLLEPETLFDWMSPNRAELRRRLLALNRNSRTSGEKMYVLDGQSDEDGILFRGLISEAAQPTYARRSLFYLIGSEAESLAKDLRLPKLPAVLIADDHYTLLGGLAQPANEAEVLDFLVSPEKHAIVFAEASDASDESSSPLRAGMPQAWLVGGLEDGLAGLSIFSLDPERVLRPNPGEPYLSVALAGGVLRSWRETPLLSDGSVEIAASTEHSTLWSRGSAYALIYLHVAEPIQALLHWRQSGIQSWGWLDGRRFDWNEDPKTAPALSFGVVADNPRASGSEPPNVASLALGEGWHCLLIKLGMQFDQGQRFYFRALFTDSEGRPMQASKTRLSDPLADSGLNRIAAKLRPVMFVEAPGNLPHPADPIRVRMDLRWHVILEEASLPAPLPRFQAKIRLRLEDYVGNEIETREVTGLFPGEIRMDFASRLQPGYYALYPSLHTLSGRLIMNYPADGFSVVGGSAEQMQRLEQKKLWNNDYYAFADGDRSFQEPDGFFNWLQRTGIFRNIGSYPGFDPQYQAHWERAKQLGLVFFADSSGDSAWLNDTAEDGRKFMTHAARYTRFFKASNEIDIRSESEWRSLRDPVHWVERAKREYETVHSLRREAHYVGGSLVRPGDSTQAGQWFKEVLRLGLDRYQDAWDVHAYPQWPPRFGGTIGNAESEDERGVVATYASLDRENPLPFWLGETGAKAMHGASGRRWQAEQVAKMIAWVNSRADYLGIAFCIAHEYDLAYGRIWDYSMGHKPGEAALYTAGALIDGLPYRAVDTGESTVQAAYFGNTFMIWRSDELPGSWRLDLAPEKQWLVVDVVGRTEELKVDPSRHSEFPIGPSPIYVLERAEYERLTRY